MEMDDDLKRLCRLSYTIMSACWTPAHSKEEWAKQQRADREAVDGILAGRPPTEAQRRGISMVDGSWAARMAAERARKLRMAARVPSSVACDVVVEIIK